MKIEEMIAANRADCSGCEACANICPKNAITMTRDAEGFAYPKINLELCIKCGKCDATCPALNFTKKTITELPPTFVATYDNDKILRHSSSGGLFTALSEIVFKNGGIVFGAAFDKNWRVVHTSAKNLEELEKLRGSKYVQSQIGDVYRQVKDELKSQPVLFSGTPCQCAGLKHFLGGDHENLLTVEILCHGTPSPALWEKYIGEVGYAYEISHFNFRSKRKGWGHNIDINFVDRGHIIIAGSKSLYDKLFLISLISRPSCHNCKFKIPHAQSDLSLGDAWGIKNFAPEMYDNRGVSVVFIHTAKGKDFFEQTKLKTKQVKFVDVAQNNLSSIIANNPDSRREKFFAELAENSDWFSVMQKYHVQDDEEIIKERRKKNRVAYQKNLQEILAPFRKKFDKNILVIASPLDRDAKENLANSFEQKIENCNVFILQTGQKNPFVWRENFSGANAGLKDVAALTNFVKKYNIEKIYVEQPLNFGENSSVIDDWIKSCNLPVNFFADDKKIRE